MTHEITRRGLLRGAMGVAGAAVAGPALLAACGSGPGAAPSPSTKRGGTLVMALTEPDTLYAPSAGSALAAEIFSFIANGLTKLRQPDMAVVPDLASSWTVSGDGRTYTFMLRSDVRWQDGTPFSADDVKFTYEYMASPLAPGPLAPELANLAGASEYKSRQANEITGVKVLDAGKVEFTLLEHSATFLGTVAAYQQLPKHLLSPVSPADAPKSPFARKPIYTGPFTVKAWRSGEEVDYTAFDRSFSGRPLLDGIVARDVPDPSTQVAQLKTGEVDLAFVTADTFDSFASSPDYGTQRMQGTTGWWVAMDLTTPFFSDVRVRQAMNHAVDRDTIIKTLFRGRAQPSYTLASPLSWIHDASAPRFTYDVTKARQLLDAAGWRAGSDGVRVKDGRRFEFQLDVTSTTKDWAVALQPYFKAVGLAADLNLLEFGTWLSKLKVGSYQASFSGWGNFLLDPRSDLSVNWESPRTPDTSGYHNPQVDALFKQARAATSRAAEKKLYDRIQQIVGKDCLYLYCWRVDSLMVVGKKFAIPKAAIQPQFYSQAPQWSSA